MLRLALALALVVYGALAFPASIYSGTGLPLCGGFYDVASDSATIIFTDGRQFDLPCNGDTDACKSGLSFLSSAASDVVRVGEPLTKAFALREKFAVLPPTSHCPLRYTICGIDLCLAD